MEILRARRADTPEDFQKLGIDSRIVAEWEDTQRVSPLAGYWEWWYFDSVLDDGSKLVIVFGSKPYEESSENHLMPFVKYNISPPNGEPIEKIYRFSESEFSSDKEQCNIKIGNSCFKGDLNTYQIDVDLEDFKASITLKNKGKAWRPDSGITYYGDEDEKFIGWLVAVPLGEVQATITRNGETTKYTGEGYHDHNWGNAQLAQVVNHWYWGGALIGNYRVICAYLVAEKTYANKEFFTFFIINKDGQLIYENAYDIKFTKTEKYYDDFTGKPVYSHIQFENGEGTFRLTWERKSDLVRRRFVDGFPEPKKSMAIKAGFDGAYLRFNGLARIERFENGKLEESFEGNALYELMFFGKEIEESK